MRLLRIYVPSLPPFRDLSADLSDELGQGRSPVVVLGSSGVGKTTLLEAIASTRPGHCLRLQRRGPSAEADDATAVVTHWSLGPDDPDRPHPLVLASPQARVYPDESAEALRRREVLYFDRLAREGGFAFCTIPSHRWFSRHPVTLSAPGRTIARHDPKGTPSGDGTPRADLAREVKQVLVYAVVGHALERTGPAERRRFDRLAESLEFGLECTLQLMDYRFSGIDPLHLEPVFADAAGRSVLFDDLPSQVKHLVAFVVLPIRAFWAAHPARRPSDVEGVVLLDDAEEQQDPSVRLRLTTALREALPAAQWILTTSDTVLASSCSAGELVRLARDPSDGYASCDSSAILQ